MSLTSSTCWTTSASGAPCTEAMSWASASAGPTDGFPATVIPRRRSASANTWAAAAAGSALRPASPVRSRPSSTHSGEIGLTTPSGTSEASQRGFTAGPVNSEVS